MSNEKWKIAYTTVISTIDRLHVKVTSSDRSSVVRQALYWPKMGSEEFNSHAVRKIVGNLVNKFGKGMVTSCFTEEVSNK